jgi:hypothetical protein
MGRNSRRAVDGPGVVGMHAWLMELMRAASLMREASW